MYAEVFFTALVVVLGPALVFYVFLWATIWIRWRLWDKATRHPILRLVTATMWLQLAAYVAAVALDARIAAAALVFLMLIPIMLGDQLVRLLARMDERIATGRAVNTIMARIHDPDFRRDDGHAISEAVADLDRFRSPATSEYIDSIRGAMLTWLATPSDPGAVVRWSDRANAIARDWSPAEGWIRLAALGTAVRVRLIAVARVGAFATAVVAGLAYHDVKGLALASVVAWAYLTVRTSARSAIPLGLVGFGTGLILWFAARVLECPLCIQIAAPSYMVLGLGTMVAGPATAFWLQGRDEKGRAGPLRTLD
jgi:hypothetical protein